MAELAVQGNEINCKEKEAQKKNHVETIQNRNQIMGTPREYGFNDISKENILKTDLSLSRFFVVFFPFFLFPTRPSSFTVSPFFFSRQVVLCRREKGATTQVLKPTVLSVRPTEPHWPTAVLVSVRTHVSCLDEGWMLSTVLECIGTAGGAGMPALALLSLSVLLCSSRAPLPFQSQIKDKHHSFSSRSDPEVVVTHICFLGCLT